MRRSPPEAGRCDRRRKRRRGRTTTEGREGGGGGEGKPPPKRKGGGEPPKEEGAAGQPPPTERGGERGANHRHTERWRESSLMSLSLSFYFISIQKKKGTATPPKQGRGGRQHLPKETDQKGEEIAARKGTTAQEEKERKKFTSPSEWCCLPSPLLFGDASLTPLLGWWCILPLSLLPPLGWGFFSEKQNQPTGRRGESTTQKEMVKSNTAQEEDEV